MDWIGIHLNLRKTLAILLFGGILASTTAISECDMECTPTDMQCAFDFKENSYQMFSSKCAMAAYSTCNQTEFIQTPIKYCIKYFTKNRRSMYGESCPVFCPKYYRPVCGASKMRSYVYRTFNNGCYLDLINCRGDEDYSAYVEVPLQFCQNHLMKNIFKEQVVVSNLNEYQDYN